MTSLLPSNPILPALFWVAAAGLCYTFVGYPRLIALVARRARAKVDKFESHEFPSVSVVLVAHNEEARIVQRLENLLAGDFPKKQMEILIVSDGSTDATVARVESFAHPAVHLIEQPARIGKAGCLNLGIEKARGEIIVFADARQRFSASTIRKLTTRFSDPKIGAVSGSLEIEAATSGVGAGVDAYWRLEKALRCSESQFDSCIGCTGAVYAIRTGLFEPIPTDTILDDVLIPMQIAVRGFRVVFDPAAIAFDPQSLEPARENVRKQRTLAGNFQMLVRHPSWLLPWRNRLWWQLISHKYMRLAAPLLLLVALVSNSGLLAEPLYFLTFVVQCIFYTLALAGLIFSSLKSRLLSAPSAFLFLNLMVLRGFWYFLTNRGNVGWRVKQTMETSDAQFSR